MSVYIIVEHLQCLSCAVLKLCPFFQHAMRVHAGPKPCDFGPAFTMARPFGAQKLHFDSLLHIIGWKHYKYISPVQRRPIMMQNDNLTA